MSRTNNTNPHWVPEIMYEESNEHGLSSHIPFIPVPNNEVMPSLLYIFESRETGETEPGSDGEELPVTEMDLHQYADMAVLKNKLDGSTYDLVRVALGLEPMSSALKKGSEISKKIINNINK